MQLKGAYNYAHTSEGKNDECWTHRYAVEPLLEFMEPLKGKIIWCPFDTEESEFVIVLQENNFNVVFSHIWNGQDFYTYKPEKFDAIVSNPPFTGKRQIISRALSFDKPFALIMPATCLNDKYPKNLFYEQGKYFQTLSFDERMTFKGQAGKKDEKINFSAFYMCWNFLPEGNIIRSFAKQLSLLS